MKRRGFILLIALALAVVVMIAGFYQISIDAGRGMIDLNDKCRMTNDQHSWPRRRLGRRMKSDGKDRTND